MPEMVIEMMTYLRHKTHATEFPTHMISPRFIPALGVSLLAAAGLQAGLIPGSKSIGAVWFVGDSITLGKFDNDPTGSPRKSLYDLLVAQGYTFSFTGHYTDSVDGLPNTGDTPATNLYQYHSGVSGSVIGANLGSRTGMTQNLPTFWTSGRLASVKPDVILIMLGTNDVSDSVNSGISPGRLVAHMNTLLNAIYALPGVGTPTVIVASIPPNRTNLVPTPNTITNTAAFNAGLPGVVTSQQALGRDVHFVDPFTPLDNGFATNMIATDNLHPNSTGNATIAQQWFNAIDGLAGSAPAYAVWAQTHITGIRPGAAAAASDDPDGDGRTNLYEFAFNGDPLNGADSGQVHVLTTSPAQGGTDSGCLVLTIAVRAGTPDFSGAPSPAATHDGITYTIEGGSTLSAFGAAVNVLAAPVTGGLPAAGTGYEYRSFSLAGSEGLAGSGFLRARVTQP
ncbi:MAG: GDSL-type esterase/lipase family protein [Verrucomicrobiota bacterium]